MKFLVTVDRDEDGVWVVESPSSITVKMVPAMVGFAPASELHHLRDACSFVVPCIFCEGDGRLDHFQRVPILGNAFYREFKKVIKQRLAL